LRHEAVTTHKKRKKASAFPSPSLEKKKRGERRRESLACEERPEVW